MHAPARDARWDRLRAKDTYREIHKLPVRRATLTARASVSFRFKTLQHEVGCFEIVSIGSPAESSRHAYLVLQFPILAHLPFAFQPRNCEPEANNAAQHLADICPEKKWALLGGAPAYYPNSAAVIVLRGV